MDVEPSIAGIGALIGNPARASILSALMDGRALTATELAFHAGVSPQTTSSHLAKLTDAKLLAVESQGRHRYYRLADRRVAEALEPLTAIVAHRPVPQRKPSKELLRLRDSRLCYDHLAGRLGVALADAMLAADYLRREDRDFRITDAGAAFFAKAGLDLEAIRKQRRATARVCLDWSERRPHVGGALGAALATRCLKLKWIARDRQGRRVRLTPAGKRGLAELLPNLSLAPEDAYASGT